MSAVEAPPQAPKPEAAGGDGNGNGDKPVTTKKEPEGSGGGPNVALASVVTVVTLAAFLIAVVVLWGKVDSATETAWARWTFLLAGIEAPAFAAIGWLFGKEVHRAQAEKAEQGEAKAQGEAAAATEQATVARQEKATLEAAGSAVRRVLEAPTVGEVRDRLGDDGPPSQRAAARTGGPDIEALRAIAQAFPRD
jgi:hypothetical protein